MIDQLIIGDKASFDDFGASLATRKINMPAKKSIKETVPFSNITYDFSAINGEVYWEERELEYTFEIIADTPEKLEELKAAFAEWVMNIIQEDIHDPFIPDYHFIGTYDDMSFGDEEGLDKTTAAVTFTAYPYKISNYPRVYNITVPAGGEKTAVIDNGSSHRITPTIKTDGVVTLTLGGNIYTVPVGEVTDDSVKIKAGVNEVTVKNTGAAACNVSIMFSEEVF